MRNFIQPIKSIKQVPISLRSNIRRFKSFTLLGPDISLTESTKHLTPKDHEAHTEFVINARKISKELAPAPKPDTFAKRAIHKIIWLVSVNSRLQERYWLIDVAKFIFGKKAIEALPSILETITPYNVNAQCLTGAIARFGKPAIPMLLKMLESKDELMFRLAADALAIIKEPSTLQSLENLLTRSGTRREFDAMRAIGKFGGSDAVRILTRELEACSNPKWGFSPIISALVDAGATSSAPLIFRKVLESNDLKYVCENYLHQITGLGGGGLLLTALRKEIKNSKPNERLEMMRFAHMVELEMASHGFNSNPSQARIDLSGISLSRSIHSRPPIATFSVGEPKREMEVCLT